MDPPIHALPPFRTAGFALYYMHDRDDHRVGHQKELRFANYTKRLSVSAAFFSFAVEISNWFLSLGTSHYF
jgi:hypothetical protein